MALILTLSSVTNGTLFGFDTINGVIGGNATINWGDGTTSTIATGVSNYAIDHTYTSAYSSLQVQITGTTLQQIGVNNGASRVTTLNSFGNLGLTNLRLVACTSLTTNCVPSVLPSSITNLYGMFFNCYNFNDPTILSWDTSNVTNTSAMFLNCISFNQDISVWNMQNVVNMNSMFLGQTGYYLIFNQPIGNWNVSNVTNMQNMFANSTSFNKPLNDWNVSKVTDTSYMFVNATAFNQPLNNWNVSSVTTMRQMFYKCSSFNQPLNTWNVSNVTTMQEMFQFASAFNQSLETWNVKTVNNMTNMFSNSLSVVNMDSTLNAWSALPTLLKVVSLSTISYTHQSEAIKTLISKYNWTITGSPILKKNIASTFATTALSYAGPVGISPAGNYYVQDISGSTNIYVYGPSGNLITSITTSYKYNDFTVDTVNNKLYCVGTTTFGTVNFATNDFSSVTIPAALNKCILRTSNFMYATTSVGYKVVTFLSTTPASHTAFFTASGNIVTDSYGAFTGCAFDKNYNFFYCITKGGYIYSISIYNSTILRVFQITNINPLYGTATGIVCGTKASDLYITVGGATSTTYNSPGAVYKITKNWIISLFATTDYGSYSLSYDLSRNAIFVTDQKNIYNLPIPFIQTQNLNNTNNFVYSPFSRNGTNYASIYMNPYAPMSDGLSSYTPYLYTVYSALNNSLYFPGTNTQNLKLENILFKNTGFSFTVWMMCITIPTNNARIFDFGDPSNNYNVYMQCPSNGSISLGIKSPSIGTANVISLNYTITDSGWHHYALTISSAGLISFYVDGIPITIGTSSLIYPTITTTLTNCYIGNILNVVNGYLNACMNQLILFHRELTYTEILYLINPDNIVLSSFASGVIPSTTDTYSTPTLPYGLNASFKLSYSSPFLITNVLYSLMNGSNLLDTKPYYGYFSCDVGYETAMSVAVDEYGIAWSSFVGGIKHLTVNTGSVANLARIPISGVYYVYQRIRYYNGLIYGVGSNGLRGDNNQNIGHFFYINTTTKTTVQSFSSITYHYNDIAISKSGIGYMTSGGWNNYATSVPYQWQIDTIDLQTLQITPLISGNAAMFKSTGTIEGGLLSIVFDSNEDLYVLERFGYLTKWSKSGVRLMAPRQLLTAAGVAITSPSQIDLDTATNDLYYMYDGYTIKLNTTTWVATNIFYGLYTYGSWVTVDSVNRKLYFNGASQSTIERIELNAIPTITFNATLENITLTNLQLQDGCGNAFGVQIVINGTVPCFLQGSKILRLDPETDEESYVPVETLRRGDLIRTATCGYKAVAFIGRGTLTNPTDDPDKKNRLYGFRDSKGKHPTLYLTGEHCLLYKEKDLSAEKRREAREHMGDDYITETFHRIPACLDERREAYRGHGPATIWHFALEHNNLYNNYAVWANGILVETCSIDFLTKKARLELV